MIAIIRIKGRIGSSKEIEKTLSLLKLKKKNHCVILNLNEGLTGMIKKIKRYITWGEIDKETLEKLLKKRGRLAGNKRLTEEYLKQKTKLDFNSFTDKLINGKVKLKDVPGMKTFFRLKPPTKGFKNTKKEFSLGGDFGYRGKHINDLLKRMI